MINKIKQLSKFAFNFSNMDTIFIDKKSDIKLYYGFSTIPVPLRPYFSRLIDKLQLNNIQSKYDVLFHTNSYKLNYISAKVYNKSDYIGSIVVGPYLLEEPTVLMIESVISDNKITISLKNIVKQYYLSLPIISTYKSNIIGDFLCYLVSTFHSNCIDKQKIGKLTYDFKTEYTASSHIINENAEVSMQAFEKRYRIENEMLHAVETGNKGLYEKLLKEDIPKNTVMLDRIPNDPLRNSKNSIIILNTLLRKAAEKGGLHPIYLDAISSKYAIKIEKCTSLQQVNDLTNTIYIEYCDAVKNFSLKNYSSSIRKAMEFIQVNLNQSLNLNSISEAVSISPSELSRQFKKETGENITEYINKKRINEALFILENKNVSITDAAYMVGFNEVDYFTKVFKKIKGITPSEYRKSKC